jgi:hypothetical protein
MAGRRTGDKERRLPRSPAADDFGVGDYKIVLRRIAKTKHVLR